MRDLQTTADALRDLDRAAEQISQSLRMPEDVLKGVLDIQRMVDKIAKPAYLQMVESTAGRMIRQMQLDAITPSPSTLNLMTAAQSAIDRMNATWSALDAMTATHLAIDRALTLNAGLFKLSTRDLDFAATMTRQLETERLPHLEFTASLARSHDAARALGFDFQGLSPVFEQFDRLIVDAPTEVARRYTIKAAVTALFEAWTDTDTERNSAKKEIRFWLVLMFYVWTTLRTCQLAELHRAEIKDVRRVQREQAETIAMVTALLRRQNKEIDDLKVTPRIYLEVREDGILREAPSGSAVRVGRLKRGQVVRLVDQHGRWRYIELLDEGLQETGTFGWIYRRNVAAQP